MEPVDLTGMPRVEAGRTTWPPPAILPTDGTGVLVFEELNRAPSLTRTPVLELLTSRRLNQYVLPEGWMLGAAINPSDGTYAVDSLDPAFLTRFIVLELRVDHAVRVSWAHTQNIHPSVLAYVEASPAAWRQLDFPVALLIVAEYAVEATRRWWQKMGSMRYRNASELLITADGGGSNGSRCRL
jgi:hypothetical protein